MNPLVFFRTLVIGAVLLLELALLTVAAEFPHPMSVVFMGIVLAQLAVSVELAATLTWPASVRVVAAAAVVAVTAHGLALVTAPSGPSWLALLAAFSLMIAGPAVVERLRARGAAGRARWRFTIANLLDWTTAVAILLGCLRLVELPRHLAIPGLLYCAGFALICLVVRWTTLRGKSVVSALSRGALWGAVVGCALSRVENSGPVAAFVGLGVVLACATAVLAVARARSDLVAVDCPAPAAGG